MPMTVPTDGCEVEQQPSKIEHNASAPILLLLTPVAAAGNESSPICRSASMQGPKRRFEPVRSRRKKKTLRQQRWPNRPLAIPNPIRSPRRQPIPLPTATSTLLHRPFTVDDCPTAPFFPFPLPRLRRLTPLCRRGSWNCIPERSYLLLK